MSLRNLRKALAGTFLSPEAEEALASAGEKERQDASYMEYLEAALAKHRNDEAVPPRGYRQEWQQTIGYFQHSKPLEEIKENILALLVKHQKLKTEPIAEALSIEKQLAIFHLTELKADGFVDAPLIKFTGVIGFRPLERAVDEWVVQPLVDAWFANRLKVGRVRFTAAVPAQSSPRDFPDNVTVLGGARGGADGRAASSSATPITFSQE